MMNTEGFSAADLAAVLGNNDGFGGGNGAWWLLILLIFANNGWGNGGWGGNGSAMMGYATQQDVQSGFDQAAIMSGITGINTTLSNGFANAEISRANTLANITNQMNTIAMNQQSNCFENRLAVANLGATIAQEGCADRAAVGDALQAVITANNASTQRILDQMCQDKIDAKNEQIQSLQNQLAMANLAASQTAQTAQLLADNARQTAVLEDYLNPVARPAFLVQNPNCCAQNIGYGCGCGMNG